MVDVRLEVDAVVAGPTTGPTTGHPGTGSGDWYTGFSSCRTCGVEETVAMVGT